MKNFDRGSSGITLIALVVTIIVLLILAGVSIWTLTGNKNIINQSFEAKNQTDYKDVEEEVMQQWLLVQNDSRNEYPDNSTLAAKLQERLASKNSSASVSYVENRFDINYKGYRLNFDLQTQSIAQDLFPTQFKKVEYIESTGTQWIDTKKTPDKNYGFYIDFYTNANINTTSASAKLFGTSRRNGGFWGGIEIGTYASTSGGQLTWFRKTFINPYLVSNKRMQCYCINDVYKTSDGKEVILSKENSNNLFGNLYLFAIHDNEGVGGVTGWNDENVIVKIFEYRAYSNSDLTQCFIPCYSTTTVTDANGEQCPTGTIGLYDTVEGKFYTNQGTGEFLKGPDI